MKKRLAIIGALVVNTMLPQAFAHERLADERPVPAWIKKACCGPNDYHALSAEQVHATPKGWRIDGYKDTIPFGSELPSPDGTYHAFWIDHDDGTQSRMFCLFLPPRGA